MSLANIIAVELGVSSQQVVAAIELIDGGATVPFISRYRKEVTGGLSDTQLRHLEERLVYLRELEDRRQTILKSISEQEKLTPELQKSILEADTKSLLEDLYLPYKPKRRTKAQIAKEAGLEPLALGLWQDPKQNPETFAEQFINPEKSITTVAEALDGAKQILMELFAEHAGLLTELRTQVWNNGLIKGEVLKNKEQEGNKFSDYFNYQEAIKKIPSHRALALFRGQREEILSVTLFLSESDEQTCKQAIADQFGIVNKQRPADKWLQDVVNYTWRVKLSFKIEVDLMMRLRESAEAEAIKVFANNLKHLLMAAPAGSRTTLALDPGLRTGTKAIVVDGTGKLLQHVTLFPHAPRNDWNNSLHALAVLCKHHKVELVSIGNGTASRETDKLVAELKTRHPELKLTSIVVSEAGASVYSASELAANEFPNLDVTYRGAVSIGRRLQDPLAELVKIEPKAIGVGQYQHDVNQFKLSRTLQAVMEDCVNAVGVDVNTASAPLLTCVAGLNESVAKNIIIYRDTHGAFKNRSQLKKVPRLGDKAFEQAAGFLRIVNSDNPLDTSAVHPEAYAVVERILTTHEKKLADVVGNVAFIRTLNAGKFTDAQFGLPTVTDILSELEKPGRDPRPEFTTAKFKDGIETLNDLKSGMMLEGVVTNVANFGAFVDIGVHQDGLVHISLLADKFVKDPNEVVKVGDVVKVKVMEIDIPRKRIQLSMRLSETPVAKPAIKPQQTSRSPVKMSTNAATENTLMGAALMKAFSKK
jgi:uncharacterized protein